MMEKNGSLQLSSYEYFQIKSGIMPDRIKQEWGLAIEEIYDIINRKLFELTDVSPTVLNTGI